MTMTTEMTRTNGAQLAPLSLPAEAAPDPRNALMPRSYAEAFSMAQAFARSGMFAAKSPEQAVVVLMTGMEMGLSPAMAMRGIDVIQGRPVPGAATLMAACLARKDVCRYFTLVSTDETRAVYRTHRVGADAPVEMAYTLEQARQAGLAGKDNWKKHTAEMLRSRATSSLARAVYPDLCLGLYIPDEIEEMSGKGEMNAREARNVTPAPNPAPNQAPAEAPGPPNSEDLLRATRRQKSAEIVTAMSALSADQRTAWLDRFEAAWGIRNVKLLGLGQIDEALAAMDAKDWPYEAAFQEKLTQEKLTQDKAEAAKAEAAQGWAAQETEEDPFADPPALIAVPGAGPQAEKGHGAS